MRRICDTAGSGRRHISEDELIYDPDPDGDKRGNRGQKIKDERPDLSAWKQKHVTAEYAGYRTRSAKHRDDGIGIHDDLGERCRQSADDIEDRKSNVPDQVFEVVAEDPKEEHIAEDVHDIPVHEH